MLSFKELILMYLQDIWNYFLDAIQPPKKEPGMKLIPIESSIIESIGYDAETNILAVIFLKNRSVYFYPGVPQEVYDNFLAAESKGSYFNEKIKGAYSYFKLEGVQLDSPVLDAVKE